MQTATVVLRVKRSGTKKYRPVPMRVSEFIRRYLQHVLPRGFQKVRHFGFLHPGKHDVRNVTFFDITGIRGIHQTSLGLFRSPTRPQPSQRALAFCAVIRCGIVLQNSHETARSFAVHGP